MNQYLFLLLFLVQTANAMHMQLEALKIARLRAFENHKIFLRQRNSTINTGLEIVRSNDRRRFADYLTGLRIFIKTENTTEQLLLPLDYSIFRAAFFKSEMRELLKLYPDKMLINTYIKLFEDECNRILAIQDLESDTKYLYLKLFDSASNFFYKINSPQIAQEKDTAGPAEIIAAAASPAKPKSPLQAAQQVVRIKREKSECQKFLDKLPGKSELEKINLIGLYRSKSHLNENELQELTSIRKTLFEQILDSVSNDIEIIKYAEKLAYLSDLNKEEKQFLQIRFQHTRDSLRDKGRYDLSSRYHTLLALIK